MTPMIERGTDRSCAASGAAQTARTFATAKRLGQLHDVGLPATGFRLQTKSRYRRQPRAQPHRRRWALLWPEAQSGPQTTPFGSSGIDRHRLPVSAKIALAIAGATGGTPGSPMPQGG